jgi:hypothetical protein
MSQLGGLLELIHDAHSRLSAFEAEYRDWFRPRPTLELRVERSELGEAHPRWRGAGPFPKAITNTRRVWLTAPDRLRVEITRDNRLVKLGVLDGERWWRWDLDDGSISGGALPDQNAWAPPPPLLTPPLIQPVRLLAVLRLEQVVRPGVLAGRRTVVAQAAPRPLPTAPRALRYEIEFDAEHGTILRRTTLEEGQVVRVTEAKEVAYDRPVEPGRFVFKSPDGQPVRQVRAVSTQGDPENAAPTPGQGFAGGATRLPVAQTARIEPNLL